MLDDSEIMRRLSIVTVIFLPLTAVATVFGSQFFALSSDSDWIEQRFRVHHMILLLFLISMLLSLGIVLLWWRWSHRNIVEYLHIRWIYVCKWRKFKSKV